MNLVHQLRIFALVEGVSLLLLLFVAMPLKYFANVPQAVSVVGMIHGLLFIGVVVLLIATMRMARWSMGRGALVFISALLPFGAFLIDKKMRRYADEYGAG